MLHAIEAFAFIMEAGKNSILKNINSILHINNE